VPIVSFEHQAGYAIKAVGNASLANPMVISTVTSRSCSFAGGCDLEINADGLTTMLKQDPSKNFVKVCGEKCEINTNSSTGSKAVCTLPKISTVYSNQNFGVA